MKPFGTLTPLFSEDEIAVMPHKILTQVDRLQMILAGKELTKR